MNAMNSQPYTGTEGLEPAVRRLIDATNAENTDAFLDQLADNAIVDDWGRRFVGRTEITAWNARENIGTHNRITVTGVRSSSTPHGVELTVEVTGDGYDGRGTFIIETKAGVIERIVIRG